MKGLTFLAESDLGVAEAEGETMRREYRWNLVKDRIYLTSTGTVPERHAIAESHEEAIKAHDEYLEALVNWKHIRAKRETESELIQTYRTQEVSRRKAA